MHTPRLFRITGPSTEGAYQIRNADGHRIGLAYTLKDAQLWAGAEDLLAACRTALDWIGECDPRTVQGEIATDLRAAIAKACKKEVHHGAR